jgi:hypothetical protein
MEWRGHLRPPRTSKSLSARSWIDLDYRYTSPTGRLPLRKQAANFATELTLWRAVPTDILHFRARVLVTPEDAPHRSRGVERRKGRADDHFHADHGPLAAALRPPASESRPTHRRRDRRHGPRSPSLDGAWVARTGKGTSRVYRTSGRVTFCYGLLSVIVE